jgi:DNA-binding CsgD family transcriptional regulator
VSAELTDRQRDVLLLVAEGHSAKQIGAILNISPKTVEFHKYAIMHRIGASSVAELTRYAVTHGLLGDRQHPELL